MPAYALPRPYLEYNASDAVLASRMQTLKRMKAYEQGLYAPDVIMNEPVKSQPFLKTGSIVASSMVAATTYTLIRYTIPPGTYGVLKNRGHWVDGSGFVEGSGTLTWSLAIGDGWVYDEGRMLYTIGPDDDGEITSSGGGILIRPNSVIKYTVSVTDPSLLDPSTQIIARLRGWYNF